MRRAAFIASACAAVILAVSCSQPSPVAESAAFKALPAEGWAYGDTLYYAPDLADSTGMSRIAVAVRHTDAYLYSNLWLELSTPSSLGDSMIVDTINVRLADVYGKWFGRGVGVSYVTTDTLPGLYHYDISRPARLRHIMRIDTLADIEQIGVIFIPTADATTR